MRRVFLSDVHLSPREPERTAHFLRFLKREAPRTDELYILGDLFDYWIGPKHLKLQEYREALDALRAVVGRGVRVVFLRGNRDFYMRGFSEATGVDVVPHKRHHRITVGSKRVYLCHGHYMQGRRGLGFAVQRFIQSRFVEWIWTRLPTWIAQRGARFYRWVSDRRKQTPDDEAMRLAPYGLRAEQVAAELARGTDIIVCGHIHRAQEVHRPIEGMEGTLYTLGDWEDTGSYLVEEDGCWRLLCTSRMTDERRFRQKKDSGRTGGHSTTA